MSVHNADITALFEEIANRLEKDGVFNTGPLAIYE